MNKLAIEIGHIHHDRDALSIYVGRSMKGLQGSALGNPFKISKTLYREAVIAQYREWLWQQINIKSAAYDELIRLLKLAESGEKIRLLCWCRTLEQTEPACHADIVAAALQWMHNRDDAA